jgi:hypothetical protein
MRKRQTSSQRKKLENQLDKIVSLIVRLREPDCITPERCSGNLTASHYYPRTRKAIRWDLRNIHTQCSAHNNRHNYNSSFYAEWMLRHYGKRDLLDLAVKANLLAYKWTVPELQDLLVEYEKMYLDLLASKPVSAIQAEGLVQTGWI